MRRFKLRNGAIVEEFLGETYFGAIAMTLNSFSEAYKVISFGEMLTKDVKTLKEDRNLLILLLKDEAFPTGGSWRSDFDIVEELSNVG